MAKQTKTSIQKRYLTNPERNAQPSKPIPTLMNSPEIKAFILENSNLFWYTPQEKKEDIGPELLVETILNYGNLEQIQTLIKIMGITKMSEVFFNATERKKLNYYPEIYNFFELFFKKNAQRGSIQKSS